MRALAICALLPAALPSYGQAPGRDTVLTRTAAVYRACRTFEASGEWTRTVGEKRFTAKIAIAAERPNHYRLEVVGDKMGTLVVSDGATVTAVRTERKAYARAKAPNLLMGSDVLKGVGPRTVGAEIITLLLQGRLRDAKDPLAVALSNCEMGPAQGFGDRLAYVLRFRYDADYAARVYVTTHDYAIRRVALTRGGTPEVIEDYSSVSFDKPLPAGSFDISLPDGARLVADLPPLEEQSVPTPITVQTVDGRTIALPELRGKMVLLTFFFTTCGPCNDEAPHLQAAYEVYKDKGLEIIAVNGTGESADEIKKWADGHGLTYPVAMNKTKTDLVRMYGIKAYPTNIIFNREGKLVYKGEGFDPEAVMKILRAGGVQ